MKAVALAALLAGCTFDVDLGDVAVPEPGPDGPSAGSCVLVEPAAVDFGFVRRGETVTREVTLTNGCEDTLSWTGLKLGGDQGFEVLLDDVQYRPSNQLATQGTSWPTPRPLDAGESLIIPIRYTPTTSRHDLAELRLLIDSPKSGDVEEWLVQLEAGRERPCIVSFPKALNFGAQLVGQEVRRTLSLSSCGTAPVTVSAIELRPLAGTGFSLETPPGLPLTLAPGQEQQLVVTYLPTGLSPNFPVSEAVWDVAELRVESDDFDARLPVDLRGFGVDTAVPLSTVALRVQLTWFTPNDPDQNDTGFEVGTDVDLHFIHPFAVGADLDADGVRDGWFDLPFDIHFANPDPTWAEPPVGGAPLLVADDMDGAGPEVIEISRLQSAGDYRIGVHYWADNGFGPSLATLSVYLNGALRYQSEPTALLQDDLWEAARLVWPGPTVEPIADDDGALRVFHQARETAAATKP